MASSSLNATAMSIEGDFESTIQNLLTSAAPGLEFLYDTCRQVYPHQPNPLQVTAYIKYWLVVQHVYFVKFLRFWLAPLIDFCNLMQTRLGGPDPLDYISMYDHPGIPELHIPPHWHYIR